MKRGMHTLLILLLALSVSHDALAGAQKAPDADTLATVNGEPVTTRQFIAVFTDRHAGHAKFLGGDAEARQFLNMVIEDRLLVQEAWDIGLDGDETVRQAVDLFVRDKATKYLVNREVTAKAAVTPEDVRALWQTLTFGIDAREIVTDTRDEAEQARTALLGGADAETLARSCSISPSRFRGGRLQLGWGQRDPEWERVVFALQPGEISPVIETTDGFAVVVVENRADIERPDFESISENLQSVLQARRLEARRREYSEELGRQYHAVVEPLDLSPAALAKTLAASPDTVVAKWDGGSMTLRDAVNTEDLAKWSALPPRYAARQAEAAIRATLNGYLVDRSAEEQKVAEMPDIAAAVDEYRDYVMEAVLYRDHIFAGLQVSDQEIADFYEKHAAEFEEPEQRHVAQILLNSEAEAKSVREKLNGADFAEVAKKYSRDLITSSGGGDLGWITPDRVPPQFADVLKMVAGDVSQPVHTRQGWHLIKVLEITPRKPLALAAVKDKVRDRVLDSKKREIRKAWVDKLRAAARIEVNDENIRKLVAENQMGDVNEAPGIANMPGMSGGMAGHGQRPPVKP